MTKMQIIAKAALTAIGIYAIAVYLTYLPIFLNTVNRHHNWRDITAWLFTVMISLFIVIAAISLIFKNDRFVRKMAGPAEELETSTARLWLIASLRISTMFCGLIMLTSAIPMILSVLYALSPHNIRRYITFILNSESFFSWLGSPDYRWFAGLGNFLKALLSVYLILGCPYLIRWQLKHFSTQQPPANTERLQNE